MSESENGRTVYLSYTHALRHPVIIGHVAGWRLPWALSGSQLGAVAVTAGLMLASRPLWAHFGGFNLVVFSATVGAVGWMVRYWKIEGRSPLRAMAGFVAVWSKPARRGIRNNQTVPRLRPRYGHPTGIPVVEADHG